MISDSSYGAATTEHDPRPQTVNASGDGSDFYSRVWAVVAEIPTGKVTTYGHIARALGAKRSARMVGWALNAASGLPLPCHRVVNRFGGLSGSIHFGGPHVMEDLLRSEGVEFDQDGCVLIDAYLWIPPDDSDST